MPPSDPQDGSLEATAARWLARCDRDLTPAEQDAYLDWLREDPRHAEAATRLKSSWARLDALSQSKPACHLPPDPDLLAPPLRLPWRWAGMLAAAAALVVAAVFTWDAKQPSAVDHPGTRIVSGADRLELADGSSVELNSGASVDVRFTATERRIRLTGGEALFTVAKNPERPFIVESGSYEVRAIGTAFSVQPQPAGIAVLVTEGLVRMDEPLSGRTPAPLVARLAAGQHAVVAASAGASPSEVVVRDLSPAQIEAALAWRGIRLEFDAMPLGEVVAHFNRYNTRQLVVRDEPTAAIVVGGSFRADNLDTFLRLLDSGLGVSAEPDGQEIVLRRR